MIREKALLVAAARAWIDGDPDPETRAELWLSSKPTHLRLWTSGYYPLSFGTAGLRGAVARDRL